MNLKDNEIIEKLRKLSYKDEINGKTYYVLNDIVKELDIATEPFAKWCAYNVMLKLKAISYPTAKSFMVRNNGEIYDLSPVGLMFTVAEIAKQTQKEEYKPRARRIAQIIKDSQKVFYPEMRVILRKQYTFVTKEFRSRIKELISENASLKDQLRSLYSIIIKSYYSLKEAKSINVIKTGKETGNYLDYITCKELQDLIDVQQKVLERLDKNPKGRIEEYIHKLCSEKRMSFYTFYADCYPKQYCPHTLKPKKGYEKFIELLNEYELNAKNLNKDVDNLSC